MHRRGGGLSEVAVRALVKTWQTAQNARDFATYQTLYAQKFEGLKRAGPRTYRFGRKGWLADRKPMFSKKVAVTVGGLSVSVHGPAAIVRFEQTWASAQYKDQGPKQLVVVAEGAKLRIAREEMLASQQLAAPVRCGGGQSHLGPGRG